MKVIITDESFTPSPQDMTDEFWKSDAKRQAEILYSLSLICKYDFSLFCIRLFAAGEQLDKTEREDIVFCLRAMISQIER